MKINEQWLREWINPEISTEKLVAQLTMAGLEVDAVDPVAGEFNSVVVGLVTETAKHPQADRLTLCKVDVGQDALLDIVCGASNVRSELKVAVAMVGAKLPNGLKIKKSKLRGEPSHGMLCSEVELGLAESSEGIMELPVDAPVGIELREYLLLDDSSIDVDLTPNRGDCLSIQGIAREVAVLNDMNLEERNFTAVKPESDTEKSVHIDSFEHCGQYCGRVMTGINMQAETPLWMTERLRRCGLRPIHPVVDVTNYVMLELGQPMHAFDLDKLCGNIHVRLAKAEEPLTLLDGQQVSLRDDTLVIADEANALAIAGVMGGLDSGVTDESHSIFLESAYFNPVKIAGVGRSYGLSTDSSHRFERGVDPRLQKIAIERATQLLLEIVGGQAGPVVCVADQTFLPQVTNVSLNPSRVNQLLGFDLSNETIENSLSKLGLTVDSSAKPWQVQVPTHRFDISIEEDLIEEVARIYGYHNIQAKPIFALTQAHKESESVLKSRVMSQALVARGYHETISYSFVDPQLQELLYGEQETLNLVNPLSPELSQMRQGLWGGLIAAVMHNYHRQHQNLRAFELGLCFNKKGSELEQNNHIAGVICGKIQAEKWYDSARDADFYDIKGDVEALLSPFYHGQELTFVKEEIMALHPGQSAAMVINGQKIGVIGALHPRLSAALDINSSLLLFEINLDKLEFASRAVYQAVSKYPSIRRDLSFLVAQDTQLGDIERVIRASDQEGLMRELTVFDVYMGENIPDGKKSIAIGLTLQHASRTLIESEINSFINAIITTLQEEFDIILRE